tara:strand:- start:54645 stop:55208 length:564 start_codon:yes stop_codon:yes gene_type:complete
MEISLNNPETNKLDLLHTFWSNRLNGSDANEIIRQNLTKVERDFLNAFNSSTYVMHLLLHSQYYGSFPGHFRIACHNEDNEHAFRYNIGENISIIWATNESVIKSADWVSPIESGRVANPFWLNEQMDHKVDYPSFLLKDLMSTIKKIIACNDITVRSESDYKLYKLELKYPDDKVLMLVVNLDKGK